MLTDADRDDVRANIARIMDDVWNTISFGLALRNKEPVMLPALRCMDPPPGLPRCA